MQARITVITLFLLAANSPVRKNRMGVWGIVRGRNEAGEEEGNLLKKTEKEDLLNKHRLEFVVEVHQLKC